MCRRIVLEMSQSSALFDLKRKYAPCVGRDSVGEIGGVVQLRVGHDDSLNVDIKDSVGMIFSELFKHTDEEDRNYQV